MKTLPEPLTRLRWPDSGCQIPIPPPDLGGARLPRLTVVTPSFNQGEFLETTIRSILGQGYPNLEYFVIDGGSGDGSLEVIKHYGDYLSGWCSERDAGQADAILKGLRQASGEWFVWINSDDVLAPGALWSVAQAVMRHPTADLIAGGTVTFSESGIHSYCRPSGLSARSLLFQNMGSGVRWRQPSIWFRRDALLKLEPSADLTYCFDLEWLIRYLHFHPRVAYMRKAWAYFRLHGESKTVSQSQGFHREHEAVFQRLLGDRQFAQVKGDADLALRGWKWQAAVDAVLADTQSSRFQRVKEIILGVRQDPEARCSRVSRRAIKRLMFYGGRRRR